MPGLAAARNRCAPCPDMVIRRAVLSGQDGQAVMIPVIDREFFECSTLKNLLFDALNVQIAGPTAFCDLDHVHHGISASGGVVKGLPQRITARNQALPFKINARQVCITLGSGCTADFAFRQAGYPAIQKIGNDRAENDAKPHSIH